MAEEPEAVRRRIEKTREEIGATVSAIGEKVDVKGRAQKAIAERKDAIVDSLTDAKDAVVDKLSTAKDAAASGPAASSRKRSANRRSRSAAPAPASGANPLVLLVGSTAVGFAIGMAVPSSRLEDERIGPTADRVKQRVAGAGQEAVSRGREVATQVARTARETASEVADQTRGALRS